MTNIIESLVQVLLHNEADVVLHDVYDKNELNDAYCENIDENNELLFNCRREALNNLINNSYWIFCMAMRKSFLQEYLKDR